MGRGARELLDLALTAFFASRQCLGTAIRAAMDWALQQASAKQAVISGFHSPLEQAVLNVLMAAGSPAVVVLARPVQGATLPPEWRDPLATGRMAVVSGEWCRGCKPPDAAVGHRTQCFGGAVGPQHWGGSCQPDGLFGSSN